MMPKSCKPEKTKKTKSKLTYKQMLKEILKPKENKYKKDIKSLGGGKFEKVAKI